MESISRKENHRGKISMKAKCTKCNYEWDTKSEMIFVSCPSCNNKVKIREIEDE